MTKFRIHAHDPSEAVEQAFFRIQHERMADVPILNPTLCVKAVDFQRWQGCWLGVVITPWCMSVLLLPADPQQWVPATGLARRFVTFPYAKLAFLASHEPELGEFQTCALFSPMESFATQAQALATARAALLALLAPPPAAAEKRAADRHASRRRFLGLAAENTRA